MNNHEFSLTKQDSWDFMTILTISRYNVRPRFSMYWSMGEDIGCHLQEISCLEINLEKERFIYIAVIIQTWMKQTNGLN